MRLRCTPTPDDLLCCLGRSLDLARVGSHHRSRMWKVFGSETHCRSTWRKRSLELGWDSHIRSIGSSGLTKAEPEPQSQPSRNADSRT